MVAAAAFAALAAGALQPQLRLTSRSRVNLRAAERGPPEAAEAELARGERRVEESEEKVAEAKRTIARIERRQTEQESAVCFASRALPSGGGLTPPTNARARSAAVPPPASRPTRTRDARTLTRALVGDSRRARSRS